MAKIAELRLRAVRGVRSELRIALEGQSLIVRGDNGTGKSSIVRGLQWALRDEAAPTGSPATGEESFRAHVLEAPSAPRVSIDFVDRTSLVVAPDGVTGDDAAREYREACLRANPFLVRSQLLSFLQDRPSDRFRYLESFLDLGHADEIRDTMSREAEGARTVADRHANARTNLVERVIAQLPDSHRPVNKSWTTTFDGITRLGRELAVLEPSAGTGWEEMLAAAAKARGFAEGDRLPLQRARLAGAQRELQEVIRQTANPLPDVHKLADQRERVATAATDAGAVHVLEQAVAYVAVTETNSCPVCRQDVEHASLLLQLRERLDALTAFRSASTKLESAHGTWRERMDGFVRAMKLGAEALGIDSFRERAGAPDTPESADALARARANPEAFAAMVREADAAATSAWMGALARFASTALDEATRALPPEGSTAALKAFANAVAEAHRHREAVAEADAGEPKARRQATVLGQVADAIRHARQDVAKNLLEEISASVVEYYQAIHPRGDDGDVTDAPAIDIQRGGAGTAYVRGKFNGKKVDDPRWVYSDGHLDTVGICVFLAMRRFRAKRSNDARLMVLDDIVLSIDLVHAPRLLDVLREHFDDHQILIFTHNGIFFDLCVSHLPSFRRKVITSWSIENGPRLGDHASAMERLAESIASSTSPKEIAMAMMALLDEWLAEARFVFTLSVHAKRGEQYTLTEIWQPFAKALEDMEKKLKTPIGNTKALLARMKDVTRVRNSLGAHENQFAHEYPLAMIQELGRTTGELVKALYCTRCGQFTAPMPNREAPFSLHCRCEALRYTRPAPAPSL